MTSPGRTVWYVVVIVLAGKVVWYVEVKSRVVVTSLVAVAVDTMVVWKMLIDVVVM